MRQDGMRWGEVKGDEMKWNGFANKTNGNTHIGDGTLTMSSANVFMCMFCWREGETGETGENSKCQHQKVSPEKFVYVTTVTVSVCSGLVQTHKMKTHSWSTMTHALSMCTPHAFNKLFNYSIKLIIQLLEILKFGFYVNKHVCVCVCQRQHPHLTHTAILEFPVNIHN